ncbi:MAG: isochorismate synthase [Sporomusaceae bacterium]|nr:isochorismate synthase [Sporomusaceae bacterium]
MSGCSQWEDCFSELVQAGLLRSKATGRPVLVSHSEESPWNLLDFFAKTAAIRSQGFYWMSASREEMFAGVDAAYTIEVKAEEKNPLTAAEARWQSLRGDLLLSPRMQELGLSPLWIGGSRFDPLRPIELKWSKFPAARFQVPSWLLQEKGGRRYLTTTLLVSPEDQVDLLVQQNLTVFDRLRKAMNQESSEIPAEQWDAFPGDYEDYIKKVTFLRDQVRQGTLEKVVFARELILQGDKDFSIASVLRQLELKQNNSYVFAFDYGGDVFLGATPERLTKRRQGIYYSTCLAGSAPRGNDDASDEVLGSELLHDAKNRQEHFLVVKRIRQILDKHCEALDIPNEPVLMKLAQIQHLYTPVRGKARSKSSLLSLLADLHPTPALGGLPVAAAVTAIRESETFDRGWYGGPIGWINFDGDGEFAVALRCALLQGRTASLFAGGGIVADSDLASEYEETEVKLRPMIVALGGE